MRRRARPWAPALLASALCLLLAGASIPIATAQRADVKAGGGGGLAGKGAGVATADAAAASTTQGRAAAAAAAVPAKKQPAAQPAIHTPDYTIYRSAEAVKKAVAAIVAAHPDTMRLDEVAGAGGEAGGEVDASDGNAALAAPYSPTLTVVTVALGGLPPAMRTISPNPASPPPLNVSAAIALTDPPAAWDDSYRLLLNFGEHGRELITVEAGVALLELLALGADGAAAAAVSGGGGGGNATSTNTPRRAGPKTAATAASLAATLRTSVFKIIPMENTGGRAAVEAGALCERKNGRGVDPNRNWSLDWGKRESDYDPSEEFGGPAPFSEPEPTTLRALATAFLPHAWVNAHSGMEALFMPYDHAARIPEGPGPAATLALLRSLNGPACGGRCAVGSGGAAVGYLAHGTATDWMWGALGVPVASTWEIYGDEAAPQEDCFRMFNPLGGRPAVDEVAARWARAVLLLAGHLPGHPDVKLGAAPRRAQAAAGAVAARALDAEAAVRVAAGVAAGEMEEIEGEKAAPPPPPPPPPPAEEKKEEAKAGVKEDDAAAAAADAARAAAADALAADTARAFEARTAAAAAAKGEASSLPWPSNKGVAAVLALAGLAVVGLAARKRGRRGGEGGSASLPVVGPAPPTASPGRRLAP